MANEAPPNQAPPAEEPAAIEDDALFEAPERGSADELLDAGAHGELDAMRHSTAHVMAEAVLDLFPGTQARDRAGDHGRLLLRLPARPAAHARPTSRRSRSGWRASRRRRPSVRPAASCRRPRGGPSSRSASQPFKVEILDDLAAKAKATAAPMPPTSVYEHGPFIDLCKGPHVARTGKIGPFKLLAVAGAYWRGDEKRPMLQRIYGTVWADARRTSTSTCGGGPRRRSATTAGSASSSTCTASTTSSPGSAFWHPKGQRIWRTLEGAMRELQARRGYQEVSTPILVDEKLWQQSGHWDLYRDNMFMLDVEGQTVQPQADELPRVARSSTGRRLRSYRDLPLRYTEYGRLHRNERSGTLSGPDPRPPVHPGRRPHLRPAGPAAGRDRGAPRRGPRGLRLVRARRRASPSRRKPDKAIGDPALWERAEALIKEALDAAGVHVHGQAQGRHVLRARRSTSTSTTPSAANGRWRRSRPT